MFRVILAVWLVWLITVSPLHAEEIDWLKHQDTSATQSNTVSPQQKKPVNMKKLSPAEIDAGLKELLRVSTVRMIKDLSLINGFYGDRDIQISLPSNLEPVRASLIEAGFIDELNKFELEINRAAESIMHQVKRMLLASIIQIEFTDRQATLHGPSDAASKFFEQVKGPELRKAILPLAEEALDKDVAPKLYAQMMAHYRTLPQSPSIEVNLSQHTLNGVMHGLFFHMAKEEILIRKYKAKRKSQILLQLFARKL